MEISTTGIEYDMRFQPVYDIRDSQERQVGPMSWREMLSVEEHTRPYRLGKRQYGFVVVDDERERQGDGPYNYVSTSVCSPFDTTRQSRNR